MAQVKINVILPPPVAHGFAMQIHHTPPTCCDQCNGELSSTLVPEGAPEGTIAFTCEAGHRMYAKG